MNINKADILTVSFMEDAILDVGFTDDDADDNADFLTKVKLLSKRFVNYVQTTEGIIVVSSISSIFLLVLLLKVSYFSHL